MEEARIDYVELPSATAHELTRAFYAKAFGWKFENYGPTYSATANGTTDIGLQGDPADALSAPLPVIRVDELEAVFDNSANNPHNPFSPPQAVTFGEQTTNEMCFVFLGGTSAQPGVRW